MALLALLGTAGGDGCSRDSLIGLLSPEAHQKAARHGLADAVYLLRHALGKDAIVASGAWLGLNPTVVSVDVTAFEEAVAHGELHLAVDQYKGPFLNGFYLRDTPQFEHWADRERRRLGSRYAECVASLARRAEAALDYRVSTAWWRRLAVYDPYDTSVAVRLMVSLWKAGDPGNALLHGRAHKERLKRDLELATPKNLVALMERIRSGSL